MHTLDLTKGKLKEEDLLSLIQWIDAVPLSKQKKSLARDFGDCLCLAQIINYYHPSLIEIHNYIACSNKRQKFTNWKTMNKKVFNKLGINITDV